MDRLLAELSDDERKSDDGSFGSFGNSLLQFSAEIPVPVEPSSPQKFVRAATESPASSPKSDFLRRTTPGVHRLSDAKSSGIIHKKS